METKQIREMLSQRLEFLNEYTIEERGRQELDRDRNLNDIEVHGVTGQQRLNERLFVCRGGKVEELSPKRHMIRRKTYGEIVNSEERGDPIGSLLDNSEDWIAIARTAFVTQPKGPHGSERKLEIYQ